MLASLAFFVAIQQPGVSLEIRAERLERAAPKIASVLEMPGLTVSPVLKNDVLAFRCASRSRDEIKKKIEEVTNATFVQRPEGWMLEQTPEQRNLDLKREREYSLNRFQKVVDQCRALTSGLKPFDESQANKLQEDLVRLSKASIPEDSTAWENHIKQVDAHGPLSRFFMSLAARLQRKDFELLTLTRPRIIFSSKPTSLQFPLPVETRDLIDEVIRSQNIWSKLNESKPIERPSSQNEDSYFDLGTTNDARYPLEPRHFGVITIEIDASMESIEISVYDDEGRYKLLQFISLPGITQQEVKTDSKLKPSDEGPGKEAKDFVAMAGLVSRQSVASAPAGFIAKVLEPEVYDPLSFCAYPVIARAWKGRDFALVLDDHLALEEQIDLKFLQTSEYQTYSAKDEGGWVTAINLNPRGTRRRFLDRHQLKTMVNEIAQRGYDMTIAERGRFFSSFLPTDEHLDFALGLCRTLAARPANAYEDPRAYRVYASLTQADLARLRNGTVPISQLSKAAQETLHFEAFIRGYAMVQQNPEAKASGDKASYDYDMMLDTLNAEPTYYLPNGLTQDESLRMIETTEQLLVVGTVGSNDRALDRAYPPSSFGAMMYRRSASENNATSWKMDESSIRLGQRRTVLFAIQSKRHPSTQLTIGFGRETSKISSEKYTLNTLPETIRQQIQEAYKKAEQAAKSRPNQDIPPPPPYSNQ